jgi:hypothetical protein
MIDRSTLAAELEDLAERASELAAGLCDVDDPPSYTLAFALVEVERLDARLAKLTRLLSLSTTGPDQPGLPFPHEDGEPSMSTRPNPEPAAPDRRGKGKRSSDRPPRNR